MVCSLKCEEIKDLLAYILLGVTDLFILMPKVIKISVERSAIRQFECCLDLPEHPGEGPTQEFPLHQRKQQKRQSSQVVAAAAAAACVTRASALAVLTLPRTSSWTSSLVPTRTGEDVWTLWDVE